MLFDTFGPERPGIWEPAYWRGFIEDVNKEIETSKAAQRPGWEQVVERMEETLRMAKANLEWREAEEVESLTWTNSQWLEALDGAKERLMRAQLVDPPNELLVVEHQIEVAFYKGMVNQLTNFALEGVEL